ncbi:MAG: universal stress protein [Reichenbachiella sp.]|uniref:universal stress protein n=1 Tax=Reichenbachiella sp. TaxID=2184521 RepID=UPI0032652E48
MKNILVPIDFSDNSVKALNLADQIAKKNKGTVTLLHVLNFPLLEGFRANPAGEENIEEVIIKMEEMAEQRIKEMLKRISFGDEVNVEVLTGPVLKSILKFEKEGQFDLLVVGNKKKGTIGDHLFGTFTDKLVHKSSLPVLVVKEDTNFSEAENILMGSAFRLKDKELMQNVDIVKSLVQGSIELVRVSTPADFMSQDVFDERVRELVQLPDLRNCVFTSINFKSTGDGLIYQAAKSEANLLVIGDKHRSSFRRWILGEDLAEKVMDYSNLPVLIL